MNTVPRKKWLDDYMIKLRKTWKAVYKYYCYSTYLTEEEKADNNCQENYRLLMEGCHELEALSWGTDNEDLKKAQAEAFYMAGTLYAEGDNLDKACEYLLKAKNTMDEYSLHCVLTQPYIRTCNYLVMIYIEKHHDDEDTLKCLEAAENACRQFPKNQYILSKQLQVETSMQRLIYENKKIEVYYQEGCPQTLDASELVKNCITDARSGIEKLNLLAKWKHDGELNLWLRKVKDTLYASEGVHYKWLFLNCRKKSDPRYLEYFQNATESFLQGMALDEKNTICWGNIAVLLCDSLMDPDKPQYAWLMKRLCKEARDKNWDITSKTGPEMEKFLADKVLKADNNNMLILNLLAMNQRQQPKEDDDNDADDDADDYEDEEDEEDEEESESKDFYPYLSQLHAELRREFKKLDGILLSAGVNIKEETGMELEPLHALKISILNLYYAVAQYMNDAIIPQKGFRKLRIGHYTRANVMPLLINQDSNARFRIRNVRHLNDPSEGVLYMNYLNKNLKSNPKAPKLLDSNYEMWNERSSVYMGCFTSRLDQLTMWSRYGDQGKGCCLILDPETFDRGVDMHLVEVSTEDEAQRFQFENTKCPLYMVTYLPHNTDMNLSVAKQYALKRAEAEKEKYRLLKNLAKHQTGEEELRKLKSEKIKSWNEYKWWSIQSKLIQKFITMVEKTLPNLLGDLWTKCDDLLPLLNREDAKKTFLKAVKNITMIILDQARFLVKDEAYRDEREYRILQYSATPLYEEKKDAIPLLYVNVEKKIKYEEVCFGPLTQNYPSDSAYVRNLRQKSDEKPDGQNPEIKIRKSSIPYCC